MVFPRVPALSGRAKSAWSLAAAVAAVPVARAQGVAADAGASSDWVRVLGVCLFGAVSVGGLTLLWNLHLRRKVAERTRELQRTEARFRGLFEQAPVAILEADYTEVVARLSELRSQGVQDLAEHLRAQPDELLRLIRSKRILAANPQAMAALGADSPAGCGVRIAEMLVEPGVQAGFIEILRNLWLGRHQVTGEFTHPMPDGTVGVSLAQWEMPAPGGVPDPTRVMLVFTDITRQRRNEEAVRQGERRYRDLFDSSPTPTWVYDRETYRFLEVNVAAVKVYGFTRDEFLGMTIFDIRTREEAERLRDVIARLGPAKGSGVWRHRARDGSEIIADVAAHDQLFGGRPAVLVLAQNITDQHRSREEQRLSEIRYRTLFENAVEGIYESTEEDGFRAVNPALARMLGYSSPDVLLNGGGEFIDKRLYVSPTRRGEFLRAIASTDTLLDFESEVLCADGSTKWVSESIRVLRDAAGRRFFRGFVSDITDRRRVEAQLAEERERLRVTLHAMAEGVITTDEAGRIVFLNEAALALTGADAAEAVGRPFGDVCVLRSDRNQLPLRLTPVQTVLFGKTTADLAPGTMILTADGRPRIVEGRCVALTNPSGATIGTVLVLRDVTDRVRMENEAVKASKLESVGLLAGGIAHDFNNILAVVMGNLAVASLEAKTQENVLKWIRQAESSVMRASDLTQQLLTFSKGGDPVRTAVKLSEIIREAAQFSLHGSPVRLHFSAPEDLWTAQVDKGQIGQAIQAIALNASQAMSGGGKLFVTLSNDVVAPDSGRPLSAGKYVLIELKDTGPGIKPEVLPRIFEPYFTTKPKGSGLGLATAYSIVRKHKGHVEAESPEGEGARFRIWLPAAEAEARTAAPRPSPTSEKISGRVLYMDDEEHLRFMARELLTRVGMEVTTVADGAEAVKEYGDALAAGRRYDLVIMDLTVPGGMGGREAMQELIKIDPEVKGIVSSGYSGDQVMADHAAHGFKGVVLKPFRLADMTKAIRTVLGA